MSGSDTRSSSLTTTLEKMGARINTKQDRRSMPSETDMVVISAAISGKTIQTLELPAKWV